MFVILEDQTICLTRGDIANINVTVNLRNGEPYTFAVGDVVRFKVMQRKNCDNVILTKDVTVEEETDMVEIALGKGETKIGDVISKPTDYWYEIEMNPDTVPQTIVGYDEYGEKIFRLYPEGA